MNNKVDSRIEACERNMENDLLVRINGTLADLSIMGGEEKSEIKVCRTDAAARRREK
jgi:hypothetical protein